MTISEGGRGGLDLMFVSLPVRVEVVVSVAVIDCVPAVSSVAVKMTCRHSRRGSKVTLAGRTALGSVLVK